MPHPQRRHPSSSDYHCYDETAVSLDEIQASGAGFVLGEEEMIEFCKQNLAPYKVPKYVEFRDELPKTLVGKILRRELVKEEAERQTAG